MNIIINKVQFDKITGKLQMRYLTQLFKYFILLLIMLCTTINSKELIIMLDPSGHAQQLGRKLDNGYERGATLTFAQALQTLLHTNYKLNVILSRRAGEVIYPLQIASFANRLHVSLVINIQMYLIQQERPIINVYHLSYNHFIEFSAIPLKTSTFIPIEKAHLVNLKQTASLAKNLHKALLNMQQSQHYQVTNPCAFPLQALKGIISPAITIEIGINNEKKLTRLLDPIAQSIYQSIQHQ